jgi:hypothetical protein
LVFVWLGAVVVLDLFAGVNLWVLLVGVLCFVGLEVDAGAVVPEAVLAAVSLLVAWLRASASVPASPEVARVAVAISTPRAILVFERAGELMVKTLPCPPVRYLSMAPSGDQTDLKSSSSRHEPLVVVCAVPPDELVEPVEVKPESVEVVVVLVAAPAVAPERANATPPVARVAAVRMAASALRDFLTAGLSFMSGAPDLSMDQEQRATP